MRPTPKALKHLNELLDSYVEEVRKLHERQKIKMAQLLLGYGDVDEAREKWISKAIAKGLDRARKKGVKLGGARNRPMYDRKQIRELAHRGHSQQRIAKKLGCSQSTVSKVLKRQSRRKNSEDL